MCMGFSSSSHCSSTSALQPMLNSPAGTLTSSLTSLVSVQSNMPPALLVAPVPPLAPEPAFDAAPTAAVAPRLGSPIESDAFPSPQPVRSSVNRLELANAANVRPPQPLCPI